MKDNFSAQSAAYASYRPHYPKEMIDYISGFAKNHQVALDVATGNGQVAGLLSPLFNKVYATDISSKQIDNAVTAPNIYYSVGSAEQTGFADGAFDLVTVAQAIHWFNFDSFYKEVKRILKPDGVFAVLGYALLQTNEEVDKLIHYLYKDILGNYWDAERKYVDEGYLTIPFPLQEMPSKRFYNNFKWEFDQLIGYLSTWSAVQHYIKDRGEDPVLLIKEELRLIWDKSDKDVVFQLLLRLGKPE